jgi:hypothetical protein
MVAVRSSARSQALAAEPLRPGAAASSPLSIRAIAAFPWVADKPATMIAQQGESIASTMNQSNAFGRPRAQARPISSRVAGIKVIASDFSQMR